MTITELIHSISARERIPQAKVDRVFKMLADQIQHQVKDTGRFILPGVGVFKRVYQAPRRVTPGYGDKQPVMIPGRFTVRLKVHPRFKDLLNP